MNQEYFDILHGLQKHHALFSEFWTVGTVEETEAIPTAAIEFDREGAGFRFLINAEFWSGLTTNEKMFVLCHECLHVYFDHGRRSIKLDNKQLVNVAGDVVINHYLLDSFGFKRDELKFDNLGENTRPDGVVVSGVDNLCWRDTVFYDDPSIERNRSMEYYYAKLIERQEDNPDWVRTLDDHGGMHGQPGEDGPGSPGQQESKEEAEKAAKRAQEVVDAITGRLSDEELEDFENKTEQGNGDESSESKKAGTFAGNMRQIIRLGKVKKKRKWETVIQDVLGRFKGKERDVVIEQWAQRNRRLEFVGGELMLPSEVNEVRPIRDRIDVWFFQDTSGSCVDYAKRFYKAACTIPEDRFKMRGFCFDTRVFEVDYKKGEIQGGGGTYFHVIEEEIQRRIKQEGCKYPQIVFIITDGYGNQVNPEFPDRWHWFLTDDNWGYQSKTRFINPVSKHYELKDFE